MLRKIDYSQYGQALLLQKLITHDTPAFLIDIGANDGINGSNSRALLENGWKGILVEPLPAVFERLKQNSLTLSGVKVIQAAVSNDRGNAPIFVGRDGELGQMHSLSRDPLLLPNLTEQAVFVPTVPLADVVADDDIPEDFGVLLVDTEGWDLVVLKGLYQTSKRPRIIVTEDFAATNEEKYRLLEAFGYENVGFWGSDSFWVYRSRQTEPPVFRVDGKRCPTTWTPMGRRISTGAAMLDGANCFQNSVAGWAWVDVNERPPEDVFIILKCNATGEQTAFEAWRNPRPDVANVFHSEALTFSGFRAFCDLDPGAYEVIVIQQGSDYFAEISVGTANISSGSAGS